MPESNEEVFHRRDMNAMRRQYQSYHDRISLFTAELPSHLRDDVPGEFRDVARIPALLKPDFANLTTDQVATMLNLGQALIQAAGRLISDEILDIAWLSGKTITMESFRDVCRGACETAGVNVQQINLKDGFRGVNVDQLSSSDANDGDKSKVAGVISALEKFYSN